MIHESAIDTGRLKATLAPDGQIILAIARPHERGIWQTTEFVMTPVDALKVAGDLYTTAITAVTERIVADSDARLAEIEDAIEARDLHDAQSAASEWFERNDT